MNVLELYQETHTRNYAISLADSKEFQSLAAHIVARMSLRCTKEELDGAWKFIGEVTEFSKKPVFASNPKGLPPTLDHGFDSPERRKPAETSATQKK